MHRQQFFRLALAASVLGSVLCVSMMVSLSNRVNGHQAAADANRAKLAEVEAERAQGRTTAIDPADLQNSLIKWQASRREIERERDAWLLGLVVSIVGPMSLYLIALWIITGSVRKQEAPTA